MHGVRLAYASYVFLGFSFVWIRCTGAKEIQRHKRAEFSLIWSYLTLQIIISNYVWDLYDFYSKVTYKSVTSNVKLTYTALVRVKCIVLSDRK